jgi:hypothetical protein
LSSRYALEITCDRKRVWLGTFDSLKQAAQAYTAAWRFDHLKRELNFSDAESQKEEEFLAPEVHLVSHKEEKEPRGNSPPRRRSS